MKKMFLLKKVSALLVVCLCCTFLSPAQVFAQTNDKNTNVSDTPSYKNVSITFVDPELVGTTKYSTAKVYFQVA